MKRKTFLASLLALAVAAFCVSPVGSYYYGLIEDNALFKGKIDFEGATITKKDPSGNIEEYKAADSIVVIDEDDLTSWTEDADTSGQSIFFCSPGVHYLVDVWSMQNFLFGPGTPGAGTVFSAVTAVAPEATAANDGKPFQVSYWYPSGATGYSNAASGATTIYVVPYAAFAGASATTSYDTPGQEVQAILHPIGGDITSGQTAWYIDQAGDTFEGVLQHNAGASVFGRTVIDN